MIAVLGRFDRAGGALLALRDGVGVRKRNGEGRGERECGVLKLVDFSREHSDSPSLR
jgi:hypothetical protein